MGGVSVPGSKSEANRALVLAALAEGPSLITGLPVARDTALMADALTGLGARIELAGSSARVMAPTRWQGGADIDCGLAGTVMRFVPPLAMLADGPTRFHGDARAGQRPMADLLDALRRLGAEVVDDQGRPASGLPFKLTPPAWAPQASSSKVATITIDASASSQFVSGLLLAGASYPLGLSLRHAGGPLPSRPHIDMTIAMLAAHGVNVTEPEPNHWLVPPGALRAVPGVVEPDLTNAAAFLLAGVVTTGWAEVADWPTHTSQPGDLIRPIIETFGGWVKRQADGSLRAGANEPLQAANIDLSAASELTPVVAAVAATAAGTSRLSGIGHIRGHETDRLVAIAESLGAVGVPVTIEDDALLITGGQPRHGGVIDARGDHRMVHLGALIGLLTPGVTISDADAVAKTMPDFTVRWERLVNQSLAGSGDGQ